jgi:hypothetical protein
MAQVSVQLQLPPLICELGRSLPSNWLKLLYQAKACHTAAMSGNFEFQLVGCVVQN